MKKLLLSIVIALLAILFFANKKLSPLLKVASAYSAKNACSCYFLSGRSIENIRSEELGIDPLGITKVKLDKENKTIYSSIYGMVQRKATYKEGLGCQIIHGEDNYNIQYKGTHRTNPKDSILWPYGSKIEYAKLDKSSQEKLDSAFDFAFSPKHQTRALLVFKNDSLVKEEYAKGFSNETVQMGWSMTKSIANALIGILVKEDKLSLKDKNLFVQWTNDKRSEITLDHLLKMNSGLEWEEIYDKASSANTMLWSSEDVVEFAINRKMSSDPGEHFEYSSGTSNLLSGIIKQSFDDHSSYLYFPRLQLFNKLGMNSAQMEADESGNYVMSSFCYATPRDWAKFGILYLNNGLWKDEQILDADWVNYSRTPSNKTKSYGAHFWLNADLHMPDVPADLYSANGYQGQYVFIIPSENMVVVRLGLSKDIDLNHLLKNIIESLK